MHQEGVDEVKTFQYRKKIGPTTAASNVELGLIDNEDTEMNTNTAQSKTYHRTIGPSEPTTSAPESEFSLLGGAIVKPKKRTLNEIAEIDKYKFNKPVKTGEKKVPLVLQAFKAK